MRLWLRSCAAGQGGVWPPNAIWRIMGLNWEHFRREFSLDYSCCCSPRGHSTAIPRLVWKTSDSTSRKPQVGHNYGRPLSVSGVHVIFWKFIYLFFYGRLILRPRLTEVPETFTRGVPWVSLEKLLLGFFLVLLKLQGGLKSDEIWHIFRPRPQNFCSHARTRQNIVILKKKF